jgi:hypothetical protein
VSQDNTCPADMAVRDVLSYLLSVNDTLFWSHHNFVWFCRDSPPIWVMSSLFLRFLDHTQRRTTVGRTPLDKRSARHTNLYLITHNTHNRQTSMPLVGFEHATPTSEWPQTHALDRAAIVISSPVILLKNYANYF